jgi:hypothetical protein
VTAHSALPVHVVLQLPRHFTLQLDESPHAIVPPSTWILHAALMLQVTIAPSPSLKSQFELAVHVTRLSSPPAPLHSDESLQVTVSESVVLPWHLALLVQLNPQAESPHSVLQSVPATQVHSESVHVQPVPKQVGASLPPQLATVTMKQTHKAIDSIRIELHPPKLRSKHSCEPSLD